MKIESGDKVHIEFTVVNVFDDGSFLVEDVGGGQFAFDSLDDVVKHIPKPVEFKIGDKIRFIGVFAIVYKVVGMDGNVLFVKDEISNDYLTLPKTSCELAD